VPYQQWVDDGILTATEGDITDYDVIREDIRGLGRRYQIRELGYDPWNATQLATQLTGDGATLIPIPQGYAHLNAPSQLLEGLVAAAKLRHGGDPALRWMAGNMAWDTDGTGNIKPSKKRSNERIDGIAAGVMGLSRYLVQTDEVDEGPTLW